MRLRDYFWRGTFPEYRLLPDEQARRVATNEVNRRFFRSRQCWIWIGVLLLVQTPFLIMANHADIAAVFLPWFGQSTRTFIFSMAVGAGLGLVYALPLRKLTHRILRTYLNETGYPICMKCGYDLRGQTEPRCPECGEPASHNLRESARSADHKNRSTE